MNVKNNGHFAHTASPRAVFHREVSTRLLHLHTCIIPEGKSRVSLRTLPDRRAVVSVECYVTFQVRTCRCVVDITMTGASTNCHRFDYAITNASGRNNDHPRARANLHEGVSISNPENKRRN